MKCQESRALITASVDGELSPKDGERLALHLRACPECSAVAATEAAFVQGLRSHRSDEAMPLQLKQRLMAQVRQAPAPAPARRWAWPWALGPALALASLCLLLLQRPAAGAWTGFYLHEHSAHESALPDLQYASASPQQLSAWFQAALQHQVHVPSMPDARLLGGRVCRRDGRDISMAVYQVDGQTLSLFVGEKGALYSGTWALAENQVFAQASGGLSLAAWAHGGHLHVAVAPLALSRLKALALECQASAS
jgi:anti-sigma factor (TIGR02949 family)